MDGKKEIQGLDIHLPFSKEKRESLLAMEKEPESGSEKLLKKLQVFRMLEEMEGDDQKLLPDPYGCECFFLDDFMTIDMEADFSRIARDFLAHEYQRLGELSAHAFLEDHPSDSDLETGVCRKILNLMYDAVRKGSEYAAAMFRNLYKTYYKKEYDQLKRFRTLSALEVLSLSEDEEKNTSIYIMARILCMSSFLGIEKEKDCVYLYVILDSRFREMEAEQDEERDQYYFSVPDSVREEADRQVEQWMGEPREDTLRDRKMRTWRKAEEFVEQCLNQQGYGGDYAFCCNKEYRGIRDVMSRTLSLLKMKHPGENFSFEEIQLYAVLFETVRALTDASDSADSALNMLLQQEEWDGEEQECWYDPEKNVQQQTRPRQKQKDSPGVLSAVPAASRELTEPELLAEVEELRKKLHEKEQELRHMKNLYAEAKSSQAERTALQERYEADRQELIALREHVYQSSETEKEPEPADQEKMEQVLSEKKIVIVGGHDNWTYKLKNKFKNWEFFSPKVSGTMDGSILSHADYIYFFTDFISHSTYQKMLRVVRNQNLPFGYIHTINIPANIRQIYLDVAGEK